MEGAVSAGYLPEDTDDGISFEYAHVYVHVYACVYAHVYTQVAADGVDARHDRAFDAEPIDRHVCKNLRQHLRGSFVFSG